MLSIVCPCALFNFGTGNQIPFISGQCGCTRSPPPLPAESPFMGRFYTMPFKAETFPNLARLYNPLLATPQRIGTL